MSKSQRTFRLGMVGCGRISQLHAQRVIDDGRAQLAAVCDADRGASESLRNEFAPATVPYLTLDEMLASAELDAVIIASPTHLHYQQALACLTRGWHVLCEKPLADSRPRIVELVEAAASGKALLSVAYQRRYWAIYRTLRREVLSGRWGSVQAVTSNNIENWQQVYAGTWRDDPALNLGGFVGDAGSHKVDTVFYATGLTPREVFAQSDQCGSNVEVIANVVARLDGGIPLSMNFIGNAQNFDEELYIHCELADLIIRDRKLWIGRTGDVRPIDNLEPETNPVSGFLDVLGTAGENMAPPECALPVFDFTNALLESSRRKRPVSINDLGEIS